MGFFNLSQDEQARIDAMPGTSEVPPAGALEGLATAIPKGIAGAGVKVGALLNDTEQAITGGLEKLGLHPDEPAPDAHRFGLPPIPEEEQRARSAAAVKVVTDWAATGQDPRVTGSVGRIANSTAEGITIGVAGDEVAGPWGAASLLGTAEGYSSYQDAKAQGVDETTAREQGGLTGVFAAGSAFLPMKFGKTLAQSVIGGSLANVTLGAAQRGLSSEVLDANGYHEMASQYRIADGEAVAADLILGSAFGAFGHATSRRVNPADVDAASAVAAENHFNRSAPGVPTDPVTATAHADTMAGALHDLANGDLPDIPPERAQQLVDNVVPDPAHEAMADLHEAAQLELPGFESAAADLKPIEMAPEEVPPPKVEPEPLPGAPGSDAGNGFRHGPNGYRYRVTQSNAGVVGALMLEKRSESGNPSTFYVGKDGNLVDADSVNFVDPASTERIWQPPSEGHAARASELLGQMGRLSLDDPARKVLKEQLRALVTGAEEPPVPHASVAGEPVNEPDVPLDDFHGEMLDHLVHNYGDEKYVTEDGREVSYRQMANEMQAQRNEADSFAKLHDVAAACAARNGV